MILAPLTKTWTHYCASQKPQGSNGKYQRLGPAQGAGQRSCLQTSSQTRVSLELSTPSSLPSTSLIPKSKVDWIRPPKVTWHSSMSFSEDASKARHQRIGHQPSAHTRKLTAQLIASKKHSGITLRRSRVTRSWVMCLSANSSTSGSLPSSASKMPSKGVRSGTVIWMAAICVALTLVQRSTKKQSKSSNNSRSRIK